ncbi:MAG TPA: M56 family metallopeptidase [Balneolaceae bacterium]|nr:M56 family metallopeptidase [Balneolaceae bacterium]
MTNFIHFLQNFGQLTLDHVWLPLFIWTVIAVPLAAILHRSDRVPPVYQYHSRVALLFALPVGIIGSYLTSAISKILQTSETLSTKFIVIQNPITVSSTSQQAIEGILSDPVFWIGISGLLIVVGAGYLLFKMLCNAYRLRKLGKQLDFIPISNIDGLDKHNESSLIAFSDKTHIPFTYGWLKTKIVIPADLRDDTEALAMAVQHELMHIKHRDFLLNGILVMIKALFWIHPLTHYLYNSSQEYREITCDGEVLAGNQFSKKRYAELLFKLAEREHQTALVMSMAVNPSSLKKRIQIMSDQSTFTDKFRTSFLLTMVSASLIVLTMACTDMADNGITNTEVKQAQSQIANQPSNSSKPLYIVNGKQWDSNESAAEKLSRVKTKYIKSINVLKGEKATQKYGKAGKNGAVELTILNPQKAFKDLKSKVEVPSTAVSKDSSGDFFVAVENMPQLIGGLASLQEKIQYPETARKAGIEGRVIVQFIVDEEGNVENPQIIRGIGGGCDKEALRVVKQAKFKPGRQHGKAVKVQYSLPIVFKLQKKQDSN